jgi:hypothetical protein
MSEPPELRISYELRPEDLEAFVAMSAAASLSPPFSAPYIVGVVLRAVFAFVVLRLILGPAQDTLSALLAIGIGLAWLVYAPQQAKRLVVRRMRKRLDQPSSAFLLGPRTLELGPAGFAILGPQSELRCKWTAVYRLVQTPGRIFIYVTEFTSHVLPLPAAQMRQVVEVLKHYVPAAFAQGGPAPRIGAGVG